MKTFGVVSCNIYCNFTNYGSALQSWALCNVIDKLGNGRWRSKLVDYCPDVMLDKDPLNPFQNMWDQDDDSKKSCELTLPAIKENYFKFNNFYSKRFEKTQKYTSKNFSEIVNNEGLDGFVCGSDTIFCIEEFNGFEDGYYANYDCMKQGYSVAYAASFGDTKFNEATYEILKSRLSNFKYIGVRENRLLPFLKEYSSVPVQRVIDPTLLLDANDYVGITENRQIKEKYLLIYSRRYNSKMEEFAVNLAKKNGWRIVEISLRAGNASLGHIMRYDAGVEEFLSLVKSAEFVVTNSFHGMIFSVQFRRQFAIFSREQCDTKIEELLQLFGISGQIMVSGLEPVSHKNYDEIHKKIQLARKNSLKFLQLELENCK